MRFIFRRGIFALLLSLLSIGIILAQAANCPELVSEALLAVDEACNATGRNEACYGYDQVEASFLNNVSDDFFTSPADIAAVAEIETIRTAPLNSETGVWGVALMNLQADLPNTIPGQSVTFVLLGDVEVENAVAPDEAFVPSEGVEVTVDSTAGANVRSGPGQSFNVVGGLRDGETVLADGLSEDGQWLRVAYRERPAWLSITVIDDSNPALRDLPSLTADLQTPMQAFYLRTGIGQPECAEAPSNGLLVQGPENIEINISVNGANIRLGSTGYLTVVKIDGVDYLLIEVIDGVFEVGDVVIRRGQRSIICLGDSDSRGLDGEANDLVVTCDPSNPEPYDGAVLCNLETLPAALLNYEIDVPCPGETPPPTNNSQQTGGASDSEIAGVNCDSFSILTSSVPATNFTLSWTEATGADTYEVAVFDSGGFQTAIYSGLSGTSIGLNGGDGFSSAGYIDVRAYQAGQYACYTRLDFTRAPDPNEPIGGYDNGSFMVTASCAYNGVSTINGQVTWSNLPEGETINASMSGYGVDSGSSSQSSGTINLSFLGFSAGTTTLTVTTTGGYSISTNC